MGCGKSELPPTFEGLKKLCNLQKFAEGYRGEIYTFDLKGEKIAVKVPQEERLLKSFLKEAEILKFLNSKGFRFVPKLVFVGKDYFAYRFIEGEPFKRVWKKLSPEGQRYFLRKLLTAAYLLDEVGVFKNEFQRPFTNVLINGKRLYLLDFERGALGKHWKNLPQFLQFLVAVGALEREEAIELGRGYKKNPREVFKRILGKLK